MISEERANRDHDIPFWAILSKFYPHDPAAEKYEADESGFTYEVIDSIRRIKGQTIKREYIVSFSKFVLELHCIDPKLYPFPENILLSQLTSLLYLFDKRTGPFSLDELAKTSNFKSTRE